MITLAQPAPSVTEDRPSLQGKRVVLTRASEQNKSLRIRLEALGASVLELPLITITPDYDKETLADVYSELPSYEWIVFTSVNGVNCFFDLFFKSFKDIRCIGGMRIACVGKSTAEAVEKYHLQVDLIPEKANAESLAKALVDTGSLDSAKVLVIAGNRNRELLVNQLEKKGHAIVDQCTVYRTELSDLATGPHAAVAEAFKAKGADYIVFTSPSTVHSFAKQARLLQLEPEASTPQAVSIGPVTTEAMKSVGLPVALESKAQNIDGLMKVMLGE